MRPLTKLSIAVFFCLMVITLEECHSVEGNHEEPDTVVAVPEFAADDVVKGEAMAAKYCRSCHQLPQPQLLNKSTWAHRVLPDMGQHLGIPAPTRYNLPQLDKNFAPASPIMPPAEWRQINAYYITKAPVRMPAVDREEPMHQLPGFDILPTPAEWYSTQAFTSCVKIDTGVSPHRMVICNGLTNEMFVVNDMLHKLNSVVLNSAIVGLNFQKDGVLVTAIGADLKPNELKTGSVTAMSIDAKGGIQAKGSSILTGLNRPLSVNEVDMNGDGKPDHLVAQFGKLTGGLSWFDGKDISKEHSLRSKPGCMKVIIEQGSHGPDVWALFAQGDEGIFHYTNKGKGVLEERKVLSFPPSYGSISFDMIDFNNDGHKDIIYACGDNADLSQILKPYHGVYVYLNDGKNNFTQKYFYPIHGCNKAIALDFDADGDLDIATISEYPGTKTPWEAFIYLENKGGFKFKAYTMPLGTPFTRGMTMDADDIDGDGKPDLLLGAGFAAGRDKPAEKQPLFMVLRNKSRGRAI